MFKLALVAALSAGVAYSVTVPLTVVRRDDDSAFPSPSVTRNITGGDPYAFVNVDTYFYCATIYVSGTPFIVQVDTGSSDLLLDTANQILSNTINTGIGGVLAYGDGSMVAAGNITLADVTWGAFTVHNQAWVDAPNSNVTVPGLFQGVLGIGPPSSARLLTQITAVGASAQVNGYAFLDHVFSSDPEAPNIITFHLARNEYGLADGGELTIGEINQTYSAISSTPQLPTILEEHWATTVDAVVVSGFPITKKDINSSASVNGWNGVLDTGTPTFTAPWPIIEAIYGSLPGAHPNTDRPYKTYDLPCDTKINVSMIIGGVEYPIHPIDLIISEIGDDGNLKCTGAIEYVPGLEADVEMILGTTFLRNVYSLYDFGSWARAGSTPPFTQLLSITDQDQAWAEFDRMNEARLKDLINSNQDDEDTSTSSLKSGTSAAPNDKVDAAGALGDRDASDVDLSGIIRNTYIIMGLLGLIIALLIALAVVIVLKGKKAQKYARVNFREPAAESKPFTFTDVDRPSAEYTTPYSEGES
ncbi:acid protease [Panus rudis PR-1116 ss-1]|nr:acid protease [Panus rudis PR-1116 ss-1]